MSDGAPPRPPVPFPTPPSIESSVRHHLDVIHGLGEVRAEVRRLTEVVSRLIDLRTVDRLLLGRIAQRLGVPDDD